MQEDHRNSIFLFNSRLGKQITTIATESAPIAIETIPEKDKVSLVTSGADMTLSTFSLDDPNPKRRYKAQSSWATPGVQMALAYAGDSRLLYSGATNSDIYSWNVQERNLVSTLKGHTDIVMSLIVLQKLNNIASASLDKTIAVWDSHTNEQILRLHGHKKGVFDLTYNPNYRLLFSCGFEHDACVWSPFVNSMVFRLKGHHASLVGCQSVDNSPEVITADTSGIIKLWDVRNFQCIQTFSANLSGQETKDNSKLTCFFHSKLPSRNALQKEDDSRIYAASKMLFSFDQARVVHEATTDYTNVCWVAWNTDNPVIITASERNVIIWDALIGSKTFTSVISSLCSLGPHCEICRHTNICGEEISACCLDDRKRKIVIGDVTGRIGVYNYANGALMKTVHHDEAHRSIVVAVEYFDEAKRFIAGYANGSMCLYDENVLEECNLIRTFERFSMHPELLCLKFNPINRTAATAGGASGIARLWDYDSGKCENELQVVNDTSGHIVLLMLLLPYCLVVTSDSSGNIVIWGTRGLKWQGNRIAAFLNVTPSSANLEPRLWKSEEEEQAPRRAIPPPAPESALVEMSGISRAAKLVSQASSSELPADRSAEHSANRVRGVRSRTSTASFCEDVLPLEGSELERKLLSEQQALAQIRESEVKWGKASAAHALAWDAESLKLFAGDDLGTLRCYCMRNVIADLQIVPSTKESVQDHHSTNQGAKLLGLCKQRSRDERSAMPPLSQGDKYVLGRSNDSLAYLGVDFCWALEAHNDRIISCTGAPNGVLTSAADRLVKMWTFEGLPIGTLLQSVPVGTRSRTWDLVLDVEAIVARENEELDGIIDKVSELAARTDKPDIEDMDFTGMQLGAESADFSKSQLRQRIEKTGKLLGLDFPTQKETSPHRVRNGAHTQGGDDVSLFEQSTASSVNKSLEDALREIKSTDSAVDYDSRTKQMTHIQQRRKQTKMDSISKAFEAKTGVKVHIATATAGSRDFQSQHGSHGAGEDDSADKSGGDHANGLDQMLISLTDTKTHRDDSSVNNDMYSRGSNDAQLRHLTRRRKDANAKSKIAESIKLAHDRGPRTVSMTNSCSKYDTFSELTSAMARKPNQKISAEQVEQMRARREEKHRLFFNAVAGGKLSSKLHQDIPAINPVLSSSVDSLDVTQYTQQSGTSNDSAPANTLQRNGTEPTISFRETTDFNEASSLELN